MRTASALLLVLGLLLLGSRPATGQTALTTSGSPGSMTITTGVAGAPLPTITDAVTTYFVQVKNSAGVKKITAQLSAPMPVGTTLRISMVPPSGATSLGPVNLTTVSQDIVVNIQKINPGTSQGITYSFSATPTAGVVPSQGRVVTLSLVNYP